MIEPGLPSGHAGEVVGVGRDHLVRRGHDARLRHLGHLRDRVHQQAEHPLAHLDHHHAGRRGELGRRQPQPASAARRPRGCGPRRLATPRTWAGAWGTRVMSETRMTSRTCVTGNPELLPVEREREQVELGSRAPARAPPWRGPPWRRRSRAGHSVADALQPARRPPSRMRTASTMQATRPSPRIVVPDTTSGRPSAGSSPLTTTS